MASHISKKTFSTLDEIREYRDTLLEEIRKDDEKIQSMWSGLFHKPQILTASTPSKRISSILNASAGILDAAILGWKLYRKFHRKKK